MKPELKTLVYAKGKWVAGESAAAADPTTLGEIWRFYGNVIDYLRVALVLVAGWAITVPAPFTAAALIIGSMLLDWIDGPVARRFNQCTIFGSGVDWLADVLGQVVTLIWWSRLAFWVTPFVLTFTAVELALSIFDFAVTARGTYPSYHGKLAKRYNWFFAILDWCMPNASYSWFGTLLWLAYPFFCVVSCLKLAQPQFAPAFDLAQTILFGPAILYVWCETAYLCFILRNWREPARS